MSAPVFDGVAIVLLAAGQSTRFGTEDKLTALLHGKMLGLYAAETLAKLKSSALGVVMSRRDHPCAAAWRELGFERLLNHAAETGQASSVSLAARFARQRNASALCIALADMPLISHDHLVRLGKMFTQHQRKDIIASRATGPTMPPAIFPAQFFDQLELLQGGQGARELLRSARSVDCVAEQLIDVDTPEILASLNDQH